MNINQIDAWVVVIYLVLCLVVGFYKGRRIKNIRQYTLGDGAIPTTVLVATIYATFIGADMTIGIVGRVYSVGMYFAFAQLFTPFFWFLTAKIFADNIHKFKGCISLSEIMGKLYGEFGRWVTNIASVVMAVGVMAMQVAAMAYMFEYFLGMSRTTGALLGMSILIFYSAFGGIRAVALTDVLQFFVFFVAIPVATSAAFHETGGLAGLASKLPESHLGINLSGDELWQFISLLCAILIPITCGPFVQRYLMAESAEQLSKTLRIVAFINVPFLAIICLIGFIIKANHPDITDPDMAFIFFMEHYLMTGIKGLMIAGMLAVIMSTADSWLNTTSVVIAHDMTKQLYPSLSVSAELVIARVAAVGIGMVSVVLALNMDSIVQMMWLIMNFWDPMILIPLASGLFGLRTTNLSFKISTLAGIIMTLVGYSIYMEFGTVSLVLGIAGSAVGLFGAHFFQKIYQPDKLRLAIAESIAGSEYTDKESY